MTVGRQLTNGNLDQIISDLSVRLRDVMDAINNLSMNINGQGNGLAVLEAAGYDAADAQNALTAVATLNTPAAVYFGKATQTANFDFNNALSQYWGGVV